MILVKTIIYRVIRMIIILIITFLITGSLSNALTISFVDTVVASIYYYYFDLFWPKIEKYIKNKC